MTSIDQSRLREVRKLAASDDEVDSAESLHRILTLGNRLLAPFSTFLECQHKISLNEFRLLMLIGKHPHSSILDLVELTGVSAMSASRAVASLRRAGRIAVDKDGTDRRKKSLALTPEGERLYAVMRPQSFQVGDFLLSTLNRRERKNLNRLVRMILLSLDLQDDDGQSLFMEATRPIVVD